MVVTDDNRSASLVPLNERSGTLGNRAALHVVSTSCSNANCRQLTVDLRLGRSERVGTGNLYLPWGKDFLVRRLIPEATLLNLPPEVPEEIQQTYREAKLIAPLSGRASAAMARRCVQGIVRDFWDIPANKRGNLGAELSSIKDRIDPGLWDDIQAVRTVGDIGAHMEKNVNEVVDVSSEEAEILIQLIETLFQDWYIQRAKRQHTSNSLREVLKDKRSKQKAAKQRSTGETGESDTSENEEDGQPA
ncbi:DUF4145 domain-containing protein [Ensifer sp. ENS10]|uniref:DUF4145 domain-containing protein n=1 Tax=Ensifer sp. ENS10 TaxID=2769286 RepID=UPI0017866089|nr:DUF4145 domain-containing protein [Ensifer sp. ENS10]MBD9511941.1 DUF4145 domain-containing protein [Ensifer sp. ENS10]